MGNSVYHARRPAGVTTSVRIDIDLYMQARKKGINVSDITNRALRSVLGDEEITDEVVRKYLEEQRGAVEKKVTEAIETHQTMRERSLSALQAKWNLYLSTGPKPGEAKIEWINAHKGRNQDLQGMTAEEILKELEGW
jgi:post-segregation antitoxin (ccd killing protein)